MTPTHICLHQLKRELEITFPDGLSGRLPCSYLRKHSPSADQRINPKKTSEHVTILAIEPVGQYAVKLQFDDGHQTGIYTWDLLYSLTQAWTAKPSLL